MKYDPHAPLLELDGRTVITDGKGTDFTFRHIARIALTNNDEADGEAKYKHYCLAQKIEHANGAVDLAAEEVATLKRLVGKHMPVVIVGRMWELLDQRAQVNVGTQAAQVPGVPLSEQSEESL
jgi:hypothetical protein